MHELPKVSILTASRNGNLITLNKLINEGANVNARNRNGTTAIMIAAMYGNHRTIDILVSRGANVNAKNIDGTTALMFAVRGGSVPCIRTLLDASADIGAVDNNGKSALEQTGARNFSYVHTVVARALANQISPANSQPA